MDPGRKAIDAADEKTVRMRSDAILPSINNKMPKKRKGMTKTLTLIFTLCILPFFAFSQEVEEQIAGEICIGLSKLDLTQHPNTINSQAKKIFLTFINCF